MQLTNHKLLFYCLLNVVNTSKYLLIDNIKACGFKKYFSSNLSVFYFFFHIFLDLYSLTIRICAFWCHSQISVFFFNRNLFFSVFLLKNYLFCEYLYLCSRQFVFTHMSVCFFSALANSLSVFGDLSLELSHVTSCKKKLK